MSSYAPLTIRSFPRAILHIDGDAFFASCEQSLRPELRGKPVITGKERGIAASVSYEAKARGVERGMPIHEIKKRCPEVIWLPSDYETYSLLSKRLYDIVRRYTSSVEEYGIDECFADITGMRRPLRMSYPQIAEHIQKALAVELGFTFSIGLGPTKVIAKIASKWKKPCGLTVIPGRHIHEYLSRLPVEKVWGIGPQTTALLNQHRIVTALDFVQQSEDWVHRWLSKPFYEIWQELRGQSALLLTSVQHEQYYSIQKFKTFTPPSADRIFVFAQLCKNIESACIKIRRHSQAAREVAIFLRTQQFESKGLGLTLSRPSSFPHEIIIAIEPLFDDVYRQGALYRQTGVVFAALTEDRTSQMDLFGEHLTIETMTRLYEGIDQLNSWYGKHTVFLGSSFRAHKLTQHAGGRGGTPPRKINLFKGENKRKRVHLPYFSAPV